MTLQLKLGSETHRCESPEDLEMLLTDRANLDPEALTHMRALSREAIVKELHDLSRAQHRIVSALADADDGIQEFFKTTDSVDVTRDNDWCNIIAALGEQSSDTVTYLRVGLVKLLEYLSQKENFLANLNDDWPTSHGNLKSADHATAERQVLYFSLNELLPEPYWSTQAGISGFVRLDFNTPFEARIGAHQSLDLILAKYRFMLVSGDPFLLIDSDGHDYRLHTGTNTIGRSEQCDIPLPGIYRAVSRHHFVADVQIDGRVVLTDKSTRGTYVPDVRRPTYIH